MNKSDKLFMETAEKQQKVIDILLKACKAILSHDVANLGTESEFFRCYTYGTGKMPKEIKMLKQAIKQAEEV